MRFGTPTRLFAAVGFGLALLLCAPALAAAAKDKDKEKANKDDKGKRCSFTTADGVEINGTYYAPPKDSKEGTTVLLLHDFSGKKGGDSHADDQDKLAEELQDKGYAVLTFDFRGFGESKNVSPTVFWTFRSAQMVVPPGKFDPKAPPGSIDQKTFPAAYYPYLVNDVSAAKLFLDRKCANKELNSSNLVVIGSGQGATVGAMWMFSQYRLRREKGLKPGTRVPDWDEPEGKDIAAGVWLTMSPKLEGINVPMTRYLDELEKTYKVPMLFVYGDGDEPAKSETTAWLQSVMPGYKLLGDSDGKKHPDKKNYELTRDFSIEKTTLTGSKLLNADLKTTDAIKFYIQSCMEKRGVKEARAQKGIEVEKYPYAWIDPRTGQSAVAKQMNEESFKPINLGVIYLGNR
jgi:hypothetical protein